MVGQLRSGQLHPLPPTDVVPEVLNQFNRLARSHQILISSVTPGAIQPGNSDGLAVLPIEFQVEGGYRSLGEFLGQLSKTPSLEGARVRRMAIDRDEHLLPRLRAQLSIDIFLSEASNGSP